MIILNFIIDYLIILISPFKTFFVIYDIDNNKVFNVLIVGFILDFLYKTWFWNIIILLIIYLVTRSLQIKKKYYYLKNIILFLIYFNIVFFLGKSILSSYIFVFLEGLISYIFYIFVMKKLWK